MVRKSRWPLLLTLVVTLGGCNAIVGIQDPLDPPSSSPGASIGLDAFVGRWSSESPAAVDRLTNCRIKSNEIDFAATYTFEIEAVGPGTLRGTNLATPSCQVTLAASATTATFTQGTRCDFTGLSVTYTAATFTLTGDDRGTFDVAGTATLTGGGGDVCKYEGKLLLRRAPRT